MYFKENLRFLRRRFEISQDELAIKMGYKSFTTVQKWEDGTSFPKVSNLNKLAKVFNVDLDDLLNIDLSKQLLTNNLSNVLYNNKIIKGFEYINDKEYKKEQYFYMKITDNSMSEIRLVSGDSICVKKQDYLNKNDIGVFLINSKEVLIRKFSMNKNKIILKASNSKYKDEIYQINEIKILGKVEYIKIDL